MQRADSPLDDAELDAPLTWQPQRFEGKVMDETMEDVRSTGSDGNSKDKSKKKGQEETGQRGAATVKGIGKSPQVGAPSFPGDANQ